MVEDDTEEFDIEDMLTRIGAAEVRKRYAQQTLLEEIALNEMQGNGYVIVMANTDSSKIITSMPSVSDGLVTGLAIELFGAFIKYLSDNYERPNYVLGEILKEYADITGGDE